MKEEANDSLGISYSLSNLGLLHHKFKDYHNAEKFFLKSIRIRERLERTDLLAKGYNQLAGLYFEMNLDDKALAFWNKSYQINQEIMNPEMLSENYLGFARIRMKRKDFGNARQMAMKSISIAREGGFKDELASAYNHIAQIWLEQKDFNQALLYADSCSRLSVNIFDKHLEWENATVLANIHSAKQDFEKAYHYLNKAIKSKEEEYSLVVANNVYNANLRILENEQETKLLVKDLEIKRREKAIIILIIASSLLTAFTIFVIKLYKFASGLNKSLKKEKEKLKKKRDELSTYARNLKNLVESKTESIYHKNMQLAGYAFLNAHKMRSPITTLLGLVQLTRGNKQMDDDNLFMEIKKNVIRLDRISKHINQILAEEMDLINDDKMKKYFANFKDAIENYNESDPIPPKE
jgi:tetratricopeptide (TPR) repeat protein